MNKHFLGRIRVENVGGSFWLLELAYFARKIGFQRTDVSGG